MVKSWIHPRKRLQHRISKLWRSQDGSLNFWGRIRRTLACTWTRNRRTCLHTRTNTDVDNKHTLIHCLDLTLRIDRVSSILTSHTPATVKTMPVAQMEVWNAIKKGFVVWKQSVSESTFEPNLSSHQCFLLLIVSLQRLFRSLFAPFCSSSCFYITV